MATYKGIARYVHLVRADAPKGSDKLRYSVDLLIHKQDPQIAAITAAHEAAKANGFPMGFPANGHPCWVDLAVTEPGNVALSQYMCLKATTGVEFGKPETVDANIQPIIDPSLDGNLTSQVIWLSTEIASFDNVSKGTKAYLNGVMATGEQGAIPREVLSSKPTAQQMFAGVSAVAPQMGVPVPVPGQQPVAMAPPVPQMPAAPVPPVAPPVAPQHVMTAAAQGATYEAMIAGGWTDEALIANGMMAPPGGVVPAFMG